MKIMVALSGGVDSAVAAYILKQQGHQLIAGFMRNWDSLANMEINFQQTDQCSEELDYQDAQKVAKILDIPLYRIDFVKEYWDEVFSKFISEQQLGRTPNPDLFCNKYIKFDAFAQFAKTHQVRAMATGHYAKKEVKNGQAYLKESFDKNKDQTYFLAQINQQQLAFSLFPLADISKKEVREIAKKLNLPVASKKDSTGVCFIGERHFAKFLQNYVPMQPGPIVDMISNKQIGTHQGVYFYTLGQRKGLGIGGLKDHVSGRHYVIKKDIIKNILYVATEQHLHLALADTVVIDNLNFLNEPPHPGHIYTARFRYRQTKSDIYIVSHLGGRMVIYLPKAQHFITPGQACVIYDQDICLGSGIINETYYEGHLVNK